MSRMNFLPDRRRMMRAMLCNSGAPQRGLFCDPAMLFSNGCGPVIAGRDMLQ